jgi:putative flippase GtrA
LRRSTRTQFLRFVIVGGVNTVATYLVYLAFLQIVDYRIAFTVSFVAGIFIAYALNSSVVFKTRWALSRLVSYPLVYLVQYGLSLGLLTLLVDALGIDRRLAPFISLVALLPVTFLLNRWFLTRHTLGDPM